MTDRQKGYHIQVCQELLDLSKEDKNFFSMIIASNKSWVYDNDTETEKRIVPMGG